MDKHGHDNKGRQIFNQHGLTIPPSRRTCAAWVKKCGGKYDSFRASYYVDNHNAKDTLDYRNNEYIPAMNMHMLRFPVWVHMTKEKHGKLIREVVVDYVMLLFGIFLPFSLLRNLLLNFL